MISSAKKFKKFKKLINNPVDFFIDSKKYYWVAKIFKLQKNRKIVDVLDGAESFDVDIKTFDYFEYVDHGLDDHVVIYGLSHWKKKYIAKFIKDYNLIYVSKGVELNVLKDLFNRFSIKAIVCWGLSDRDLCHEFSNIFMTPLWFMEDGFLRSVELGSDHTTPRSIVIDKSGIYFDSTKSSDLEDLLNSYDFEKNKSDLILGRSLLDFFKILNLSKYNFPSISHVSCKKNFSIVPSVLVLGQLSTDASLKYGGCAEWSNIKLIELAVQENPGFRVIYRPHPDEVKYNKNYKKELNSIDFSNVYFELSSNERALFEIFDEVNRVYTMTSLAGFEALIRGLPVTVVGKPFYAGWGLTDDRAVLQRRRRTLSIDEIFTISYLIYPRYLGNICGLLTAMQIIVAEREISIQNKIESLISDSISELFKTPYWTRLLLNNGESKSNLILKEKFVEEIPYADFFGADKSIYYKRFFSFLLAGVFESRPELNAFLKNIRLYLDKNIAKEILIALLKIKPTPARIENWATFCEENGFLDEARIAWEFVAETKPFSKGSGHGSSTELRNKFKLANFEYRAKKFDEAEKILTELLISGYNSPDVMHLYAQVAINKFEFDLAFDIYMLIKCHNSEWSKFNAYLMLARLSAVLGKKKEAFIYASTGAFLNPNQLSLFQEDTGISLNEVFGVLPFHQSLNQAVISCKRGGVISRANAEISVGNHESAEKLLTTYTPTSSEYEQYIVLLSQARSYQGKINEALASLQDGLKKRKSHILFREAFRLAAQSNNKILMQKMLEYKNKEGVFVSEAYMRKAATILNNERMYYECFRDMASSKHLNYYFGNKYVKSLFGLDFSVETKILVLAYFGPGDEIRWGSLYKNISDLAKPAIVEFTCDPRLIGLMSRSYPELKFHPVKRARNIGKPSDLDDIIELPGFDIFRHLDSYGWSIAKKSDYVTLQLDLIADVVKSHSDLNGEPYLIADKNLFLPKNFFSNKTNKLSVGLCWRSSVLTTARNQYYLDIEHVASLIEKFPQIDFYSLQYGDCKEEISYVNDKFPGRLISFEDIDYFDDFEKVSALISNMNLVISPATTVAELSGALGVETILFCTTAEMDWRCVDSSRRDVWQRSIKHVRADSLNDKDAMLNEIVNELGKFIYAKG